MPTGLWSPVTIHKTLASNNETRTMSVASTGASETDATLYVRCHIGTYEGVITHRNGKLLVWIEWDEPVDITNRWDGSFQFTKEVKYAFPSFLINTEDWETRYDRRRLDDASVEYVAHQTEPPDPETFYGMLIAQDALRKDETTLGVSVVSEWGTDLYVEFDIAGVRNAARNKLFCYQSVF